MHGDAAGCVLAAVWDDYGDAAGGDCGVDRGYGADVLAEHEWELYGYRVGGDWGGGVY